MAEGHPRVFLSHTHSDKAIVRPLAGALQLLGANVWFDEWKIGPGESIPGAIDSGLWEFDIFILCWSKEAASSTWVQTEMNAAIARMKAMEGLRLIPVRLDEQKMPTIIGDLMYLDAREANTASLAAKVMGITGEREVKMAYQSVLEEIELDVEFTPLGMYLCCPECGADHARLTGGSATDERYGQFAWMKCAECGWSTDGEI